VQLQLNSIRRLKTIALALGEERTRRELVPFLGEESKDDEDEVLQAMADELGEFVPFVGGPEHAHVLLPVLEAVSTVEETVVREAAVASLCKVCAALSEAHVTEHFVPLLKVSAVRRAAL
jgi:serine/threonine-protein phosphatase 2A regulatory subunit A